MAFDIRDLRIQQDNRWSLKFATPEEAKQFIRERPNAQLDFFSTDIGDRLSLEELQSIGLGAEAQQFGVKPLAELETAGLRQRNFGTTPSGQVITREQALASRRAETAATPLPLKIPSVAQTIAGQQP